MQKFYQKCAALLLAAGLLFPCTTALAQMPEEGSAVVGLSSVDSAPPPATDNGSDSGPAVTYTAPWNEDEPFFTTTRAEWKLAMLPKPDTGWLFPAEDIGNFDALRKFSVRWNQSDYDAGLASGAERFTITGSYVPANAEDQALWDKGLLLVDETSVPKMEVRVTNAAALPFKVELGYDAAADGYYPIFSFPSPHGASEVWFEASEDGTNWFTCVETYNNVGEFTKQNSIYSMQYAIYTEDGEPFFFDACKKSYYRITVYGSAYDANGCGAQSTFTLNAVPGETAPPGSDLDDTGGNRGGGTQGETDRPGRPDTAKPKPKQPPAQSKPDTAVKNAAAVRAKVAQSIPPATAANLPGEKEAAGAVPTSPTGQNSPATKSPGGSLSGTDSSGTDLPGTAPVPPGEDKEKPVASLAEDSPKRETPPKEEPDSLPAMVMPSASAAETPTDRGNAGAVAAATVGILIAGAGGVYIFKRMRKH